MIRDILAISRASYYEHLARRADRACLSSRAKRDEALRPKIQRFFDSN
jgi:putative transposase